MIGCFLGDTLGVLSLPVLEYSSAIWCSAANTHLILMDGVVSGGSFLTESVFECDLAHRLSVAVCSIMYAVQDQM